MRLITFVTCLLLWASPARAALITFEFSGTVTSTWEYLGVWLPGLEVGDPFTGQLTYDPTTLGQASGALTATVAGYTFQSNSGLLYGGLSSGGASGGGMNGPPEPYVSQYPFIQYFFELSHPRGTLLGGTLLWTGMSMTFEGPQNSGESGWTGTITSFRGAPPFRTAEASTVFLLALSALALFWVGWYPKTPQRVAGQRRIDSSSVFGTFRSRAPRSTGSLPARVSGPV